LAARRIGISGEMIARHLHTFPGVPGRFETYEHPNGAFLIVDYAHTPEAIELCLQSIKNLGARRIIHIFGFRGNGDPSKRKKMLEISSRWSDYYILTLDDLNGIKEKDMIDDLHNLQKRYGGTNGNIIPDRTQAIQLTWKEADKGLYCYHRKRGRGLYTSIFPPTTSDQETIMLLKEQHAKQAQPSSSKS
jgi:UDP-N-acetylmuramoyl-L-alanyl-D-glutamate--2,6-diaminopimelate ligase